MNSTPLDAGSVFPPPEPIVPQPDPLAPPEEIDPVRPATPQR